MEIATQNYVNATITLEQGSSSMSSSMSSGDSIEVDLQSTDYDTLKKSADDLVTELRKREDVMQVHSSVENAAPVIKVKVDPVKAEAEGLTPASIGSVVYSNLSGVKAATISVNGEDQDVKVEFAAGSLRFHRETAGHDDHDSGGQYASAGGSGRDLLPGQPTGDFAKRETVPGIDHDAGTGRL